MPDDPALLRLIGRLIWVGIRGSEPGEPTLEAELDRCARARAGAVILFDVDLPTRNALRGKGLDEPAARAGATRNITSPDQLRRLTDHLRDRLGDDLIIAVDQEGGAVARLNPARGFPHVPSPRDFAALPEPDRAAHADALAQTLARAGINLNLAPCIDVEINPSAPGLTALGRAFGPDPTRVTALAAEQIAALHRRNVAATIKHFPGHASATADSHHHLPDITHTFSPELELAPYRALLDHARPAPERPDAVMVGHLLNANTDPHRPASLSKPTIDQLRSDLAYDGPVITDALDMRAITHRWDPAEAAVLALAAGADAALEANNLEHTAPCPAPRIQRAILDALDDGALSLTQIERSAHRVDAILRR